MDFRLRHRAGPLRSSPMPFCRCGASGRYGWNSGINPRPPTGGLSTACQSSTSVQATLRGQAH
jgi:hypothetical protein